MTIDIDKLQTNILAVDTANNFLITSNFLKKDLVVLTLCSISNDSVNVVKKQMKQIFDLNHAIEIAELWILEINEYKNYSKFKSVNSNTFTYSTFKKTNKRFNTPTYLEVGSIFSGRIKTS